MHKNKLGETRTFLGLKSSSTHAHIHAVTASAHYCSIHPYPQHFRFKQQQRHTQSSSFSCLTTMSNNFDVDYTVEEEVAPAVDQAPSANKQTLYPAMTTKAKAAPKPG
eukprot:2525180-Amphidinium_carterae.1